MTKGGSYIGQNFVKILTKISQNNTNVFSNIYIYNYTLIILYTYQCFMLTQSSLQEVTIFAQRAIRTHPFRHPLLHFLSLYHRAIKQSSRELITIKRLIRSNTLYNLECSNRQKQGTLYVDCLLVSIPQSVSILKEKQKD